MKTRQNVIVALMFMTSLIFGQGPQPWFTSGNNVSIGDFLGATNNAALIFRTTNSPRMMIDGGAAAGLSSQSAGQVAISNNLSGGFTPQARLHIHHNLFSLNSTIAPFIRFTTSSTGAGNTDGFTIGNSTNFIGNNLGRVDLEQFETAPIVFSLPNSNATSPNLLPYEWLRIQNNATWQANPAAPIRRTDGFIGLNNDEPRAHIDMITPRFSGGEEFFFARPDDIFAPGTTTPAPNVQMGMMNLTALNNQFEPGFFGNINQPQQIGAAFTTIGAIPAAQDLPANLPVTRFISALNWQINNNTAGPLAQLNPIITRPIFGWYNASQLMMYMNAAGRVRLGSNLITVTAATNPFSRPNNRLEITAAPADPYFNPVGNPSGNPNAGNFNFGSSSGLRFTFLTSKDLVITPNATNQIDPTKVLSVDKNGDVVAISTVANGNNGVVNNNGTIQFGGACTSTTQITASQLTASRALDLNSFNLEFRNGRVGIGTTTCSVNNRLEVDNGAANPNTSGLRLTRLTSTSPTVASTGKVLSVDANGDVILVPDQSSTVTTGSSLVSANNGLSVNSGTVQLGGPAGAATAANLLNNREIPMNTFNLSITGIGNANTELVTIGQTPFTGRGKFNVMSNEATTGGSNSIAGVFQSIHQNGDAQGLLVESSAAAGSGKNVNRGIGVLAANAPQNYGISVSAINGNSNIGGDFLAINTSNNAAGMTGVRAEVRGSTNDNYGVSAIANSTVGRNFGGLFTANGSGSSSTDIGIQVTTFGTSLINYGGFFQSPNLPTAIPAIASNVNYKNYAVYAAAPASIGGTTWPNSYAGYFDGNVHINGIGTANPGGAFTSDQMFKTNIDTISNISGIIKQLKPRTFYFDTTNIYGLNFSGRKQYGFIAQDVQTVLPELVSTVNKPADLDSSNNIIHPSVSYKALNYDAFFALLVKAVQDQQKHIEKQDSIINQLTSAVSSCCSNSNVRTTNPEQQKNVSQQDIHLGDGDILVLNQNQPNPFAEQTTITYNVPASYSTAQLIFTTIDGRVIKTVDLKKGRGQLNVYAQDLSTGIYVYSLVVDGKTVESKKMVKDR